MYAAHELAWPFVVFVGRFGPMALPSGMLVSALIGRVAYINLRKFVVK